jgi:hypothetical protein
MRNFTQPILILLFTHLIFSVKAQIVSQASGDWNDPATWMDGTIPLASNDVTINHAVVVTQNGMNSATCKNLNISSTGSLNCNMDGKLTIGSNPNGGNSSLMVDGSLSIGGDCNIFLRGSVDFGANSAWIMTSGYFEIDGNNGNVESSVAHETPFISLKPTMVKDIRGGTIRFNDPHPVTGNFLIQGAAVFSTTVEIGKGTTNDTDTPFAFGDNITFTDVNVNYSPTSEANMTSFGSENIIKGNFSMTDGRLVSNTYSKFEGNIICGGGVVEGDVICMGSPTLISGAANFTAATLQSSVPSAIGSISVFNNIRVGKLMLNNSIKLEENATLWVEGDIEGNGTVLVDAPGSALKRSIPAGATSARFPIGITGGNMSPVTISNTSALSNWSVSLSTTPNTPPSSTKKVQMQWDITPSVSGTQADINIEWDEANEEVGFNRLASALHHWNGTTWDRITPFASPITAGTTHSITKTSWSNFSPFAVFSQEILPVELVSFTGSTLQGKAVLNWTTASEKDNEGFVIEKSFDGAIFEKIGFMKGNNNSTVALDYNFLDYNFTRNAYYRLKQMDNDGYFTYSNIISLNPVGGKTKGSMKTYPNPVHDVLMVEAVVSETAELELMDAVGRVVIKKKIGSGNSQISTENLAKGIYILRLTNNNDISTQKIIKN